MFFIRHMAGRHLTRQARAGRKVRRMGLILPDGRRIKRKGVRGTPLSEEDFFKYEDTVKEWVMSGLAEITDPGGRVINWAVLEAMEAPHRAYEAAGARLEEAEELLAKAETEDEVAEAEAAVEEAQAQLDDLKMPLLEQGPGEPPPADETVDDEGGGEDEDETPPEDPDKGDEDSPEADDKTDEEGAEASEEEFVELTEDDLKKMKRGELDELAKEYKLDPSEYKNAGQLVYAIMTAAAKAEEE